MNSTKVSKMIYASSSFQKKVSKIFFDNALIEKSAPTFGSSGSKIALYRVQALRGALAIFWGLKLFFSLDPSMVVLVRGGILTHLQTSKNAPLVEIKV